jgi:hypothetical protein
MMLAFNTSRMIAVMLFEPLGVHLRNPYGFDLDPVTAISVVRSIDGATACVSARAGVVRREASCAVVWTIHNGTSPEGADVGVAKSCNVKE